MTGLHTFAFAVADRQINDFSDLLCNVYSPFVFVFKSAGNTAKFVGRLFTLSSCCRDPIDNVPLRTQSGPGCLLSSCSREATTSCFTQRIAASLSSCVGALTATRNSSMNINSISLMATLLPTGVTLFTGSNEDRPLLHQISPFLQQI